MSGLREIAEPFVADPATGVCIRTRLKGLTDADVRVLRSVGEHLGHLAAVDLAERVADGLAHDKEAWADRKRDLTVESTARWAGSITKGTHDQWGLARRAQVAHIASLRDGVAMIEHRLSQPLGERGTAGMPGGYRSRHEWFHKSRRLATLRARLAGVEADYAAGRVSVVRGGKRLLHKRHHLADAAVTEAQWRAQWESSRWFLSADGEAGKKFGNETIRVTDDGQVSIRLPAPLSHFANAPHSRYILTGTVVFAHCGDEWADRVAAHHAVAYRIHHNPATGRWYLDASWQRKTIPTVPLDALRAGELIGVDMNADHLAAWRMDPHGNPIAAPHTFSYQLDGTAQHRDAQVRHALTRLLHWAKRNGVKAIAVEDLDFTDSKTREKHGRRRRFPPGHLRHAHRPTTCAAARDGHRGRDHHHRGRPRLHLEMGRPALAKATRGRPPIHHPAPRRERGDRTARPRTPDPATDGTAPTTPERCGRASDRTGQTRHPKTRGNPPPRCWTTDTIRATTRGDERG